MKSERADAARNRAKVLAAAAQLFATTDPRTVTMDAIAKAAGIGRGTLYRRYPDVASIALALLDEHETRLQRDLMKGPPPLGPSAPPADRLTAFYGAMVDLLEAHGELALAAEVGGRRFEIGAYGFWRAHVLSLLRDSGIAAPEALADTLLAPLAPDVFTYQRGQGLSPSQIKSALARLSSVLSD